ncbi:MAG: NAD(P)-dependent dehydrogenase (short-subunit alcohol dehydrogenase family) [Candidatus Poriferisodalaceae bacterium]|jgi:NAD(P)-dependent dehydrogenase (short-subunit alcohol dehydrogenase family)
MIDLSGKVFIVTSGNGGIGLGMAEGIVMSGGSVVIWGRNGDKNTEAVAQLQALGGQATAHICDVAHEEQVIETMARCVEDFGRIDGLFAVPSTSAIHGAAGNEAYGTAKTGLNGLVRALAVGLARHQIRVNSVLPGWTITELASGGYESDIFRNATIKRTPVRRWAEPSEFREVGAFLADPSQTYHTGQEVCVDGGYTVY